MLGNRVLKHALINCRGERVEMKRLREREIGGQMEQGREEERNWRDRG
jgi:hypothetical protein